MAYTSGARRIAITFGDGFKTCSIKVVYAKERGTEPIVIRNRVNGGKWELLGSTIDSTSCSIRPGNVFAAPH